MGSQKAGWHRGKGPLVRTSLGHARVRNWQKQALHSVPASELQCPITIDYLSPYGKHFDQAIYAFDQKAAHSHLRYAISSISGNHRWGYNIQMLVSEGSADIARTIVRQLAPPPRGKRRFKVDHSWTDLLKPDDADFNGWHVALYQEYPDQRRDGQRYYALLFRDEERTQFGIQEFLGTDLLQQQWPMRRWRELAVRANHDPKFRRQLLSNDPDLPKMWRRH
ncbi:MAG TPA: hypothetical protein VGP72_32615 [Planctomycetota bacterium]|jgi:hypothetical protein